MRAPSFPDTRQSIKTAVEKGGDSASRLANCPFQQRIVAAREHRQRSRNGFNSDLGLGVSPHPGLDQLAVKQQLADDAADGYRAFLYQVLDRAFLDPQQGGDFLRRQELHHCPTYPTRAPPTDRNRRHARLVPLQDRLAVNYCHHSGKHCRQSPVHPNGTCR